MPAVTLGPRAVDRARSAQRLGDLSPPRLLDHDQPEAVQIEPHRAGTPDVQGDAVVRVLGPPPPYLVGITAGLVLPVAFDDAAGVLDVAGIGRQDEQTGFGVGQGGVQR